MYFLAELGLSKLEVWNLRVGLVVVLLRSEPSRNHLIFYGEGQSEVVISICRHVPILDHGIVKMSVNGFLHAAYCSLFSYFGNTDAPAIIR